MGIDRETTELVNMLEGQGNHYPLVLCSAKREWLIPLLNRIKKRR